MNTASFSAILGALHILSLTVVETDSQLGQILVGADDTPVLYIHAFASFSKTCYLYFS